jgi:hypothetical protein
MVDNGPQIGLCVLVVTRNGGRIIPKALKRAEQVIKVISGHPDADTQNAGVEDQPSTIPAAKELQGLGLEDVFRRGRIAGLAANAVSRSRNRSLALA